MDVHETLGALCPQNPVRKDLQSESGSDSPLVPVFENEGWRYNTTHAVGQKIDPVVSQHAISGQRRPHVLSDLVDRDDA
jgi:hypothetical protein